MGTGAVVEGFEATFLSAGDYVLRRSDNYSLSTAPLSWLQALVLVIRDIFWILIPAALGAVRLAYRGRSDMWDAFTVAALLGTSFMPTLLMKSLPYYWMPIITFLSPLAALGLFYPIEATGLTGPRNPPTDYGSGD